MKKLILSAVFALACFTANAQTTSTPETKEIPKVTTESETSRLASPRCFRTWMTVRRCGVLSFNYYGTGSAARCDDALANAQADANAQAFDAVCP